MRLTLVLSVLAAGVALSASAVAEPYPANVRDSFMNECKATATEAHCACVLGKLEAQVSLNDMLAGQVAETTVDEYVNACLSETAVQAGAWPANLKLAFVDGCKQEEGFDGELCACLANDLEQKFAFQDIMAGNTPPEAIAGAVATCQAPKAEQPPADGQSPNEGREVSPEQGGDEAPTE